MRHGTPSCSDHRRLKTKEHHRLRFLRGRHERRGSASPNFRFFQHNIYKPLPGKYDVILCTEVLEHLEYPWRGLQTLMSAARPGGRVVITVPNGRLDRSNEHINFWSSESWRAFIERECSGLTFSTMQLPGVPNNAAIIRVP